MKVAGNAWQAARPCYRTNQKDRSDMPSANAGRRLVADLREIVAEQVAYRELLFQMTYRDLLLRYKQTVMGFAWAVFMPLVNTIIFSTIFTRVAPIKTEIPYPLYAFSGLLAWNFFASSLRFAVNSLTGNANLVTKIYFPREIFPISAVMVTLIDSLVGSLMLGGMMVYYHISVSQTIVLLPVVVAVEVVFTCAVALLLAMANLFYRDVKYLFEIVVTFWMFATSVVYPIEHVGGRLGALLQLNPMTPIINAFRGVVLQGVVPDVGRLVGVAAASGVALLVAWVVFHRAEYKFAENI
jgi:lipopolysaccharide transport system permease protein